MNYNIRKVLDAIELLRHVKECKLEVLSLSHKLQSMYSLGKEGLTGIAFIDACTDEELAAALRTKDARLDNRGRKEPNASVYIYRHRREAFVMARPKVNRLCE